MGNEIRNWIVQTPAVGTAKQNGNVLAWIDALGQNAGAPSAQQVCKTSALEIGARFSLLDYRKDAGVRNGDEPQNTPAERVSVLGSKSRHKPFNTFRELTRSF